MSLAQLVPWLVAAAALLLWAMSMLGMRARIKRLGWQHHKALKACNHQTEESAAQLQAFLSAIQVSPNGVVILDADRRIEWCNQTAAQLLGLDATRDVAQHIVHLVRHPKFVDYIARGDFSDELRFDNKALQLHLYGQSHGKSRALLLVRDVTDVERADHMRRDFVANVSHEIRTPLTVLSGFIETMQTLALSEQDRAHYLELMSVQSRRLEALVTDLLTLSQLDAKAKPVFESVAMTELLHECEHEARELAKNMKRELTITFDVQPQETVMGVASELQSACSNLITNAVRYTPAGGSVTVTWRDHVLTVQDTGMGIAAEHLPRLTERFYRVDQSRNREAGDVSGTGLGLAIVKHVAQRHGAKLDIASTLGVGSVFKLIFSRQP